MPRPIRRSSFATACLAWATAARAAGGHFDVDDAAAIEPGHCQYEAWAVRAPSAPAATLWHVGPGCRVGPVELALNLDRFASYTGTRSTAGPQLKWVTDIAGPIAAGVVVGAAFDLRRGGRPAHTLYVPLTWAVRDSLALNANLGADWDATGARTRRLGASGEWVAHERLTLIAERVKFAGDWNSRLGARFMLGDATSIDLSAARVGPRAARVYVMGLNHDFER
jgi:hypothetical protein